MEQVVLYTTATCAGFSDLVALDRAGRFTPLLGAPGA